MKLVLKILLSPIIFLLSIAQFLSNVLISIATSILSIISVVTLLTAVFVYFNDGVRAGLTILVFSWLISPFGIPAIAQLTIDLISSLKNKIIRCYL